MCGGGEFGKASSTVIHTAALHVDIREPPPPASLHADRCCAELLNGQMRCGLLTLPGPNEIFYLPAQRRAAVRAAASTHPCVCVYSLKCTFSYFIYVHVVILVVAVNVLQLILGRHV